MSRLFCIMLLALHGVGVQAEPRSIAETVTLSLLHHPEIRRQVIAVQTAKAQLLQEEAAFLPQVSLSAGIGREVSDNPTTRAAPGGGSESLERRESGITLRQMLFDGFETHWRRESQQHLQDAANHELQWQVNETALRAISLHLDVMTRARVMALHEDNLRRHIDIARNIDARAKSGKDDRARVSQIAARTALANANLEAARERSQHAIADYLETVGVVPAATLLWQEAALTPPQTLDALQQQVRELHPELLAAQARQTAAGDAWRAAANHRYPKLFFESGANWQDNLDGQRGENRDAYAMLRMQLDLYQGGAGNARQRQARLAQWRQRQTQEALILRLMREAEQVWFSFQSQGRRLAHLQQFVRAAEATRTAYNKQFGIGQRSLIDLLDAENEVLRAHSELAEARGALYVTKYRVLAMQNRLLDSLQVESHARWQSDFSGLERPVNDEG